MEFRIVDEIKEQQISVGVREVEGTAYWKFDSPASREVS